MKELNVALLGLGTVGSGIVKITEKNRQQIKDTLNKDIVVKHILTRDTIKKRPIDISQYHLTRDTNKILNDEDIDIVIEVMGGIEPIVDWSRESLKRKKHVITASKDLLAVYLELLENLAEQQGVALKFEASVAGGIPIVNAINNGLDANNISKFMEILNGTSNFILSKMTREQTPFEDAFAEVQRLGFAEADPTDDAEGIDAAGKVVITSYLSFNQVIKLNDVKVKGISKTTLSDINIADKLGYKIKLIGKSIYHHSEVNVSVEPTLIHEPYQLAAAENEYNAIYVIGDVVGDTMFYGKGADGLATGSAIASDLLNVALFFESSLHTLPPHFELEINKTRELMDNGDATVIGEKLNYYVVIHNNEPIDKPKDQLKSDLLFHKPLQIEQRDSSPYDVVITGLDQSPESLLSKANYSTERIYPVEGV